MFCCVVMSKDKNALSTSDAGTSLDVGTLQALEAIRELRSNATKMFDLLQQDQGGKDDGEEDNSALANAMSNLAHSIPDQIETLEKFITCFARQGSTFFHQNAGLLIRNDPADETHLYESILSSYNWIRRAREHAQWTFNFLNPMARRSQSKCLRKVFPPSFLQMNPTFMSNMLPFMQRQYPGLHITTIPRGRSTILLMVTVRQVPSLADPSRPPSKIFEAAVLWRGLQIEWANVKGPDESFYDDSGKLCLHRRSRYAIFRHVTDNVKGLIQQFNSSLTTFPMPQTVVRHFFSWLYYYRNVFAEPCCNCKKILKDNLPPSFREYRDSKMYVVHENCR
ncbi:Mediator of RNA polymerase II transcription subun it 27 [Trichuris trichiura]|uniref:Mediator of RNA polymerase II transcription subun it 27 n=1 Tax=Trichuris trichiura TaxID=36087 RepID=A0A077Z7S4_TRITR|nr:Mediator of RNA polymerase II transcription subun it 27 [Trichuris trichiura]